MRHYNTQGIVVAAIIAMLTMSAPVQSKPTVDTQSASAMVEEKIGGKHFQVCRFTINAKSQDIWRILTDYNNAQYVFPCLKKCRVVADQGNVKMIEQHIRPTGVPTNFEYLLEVKEIDGHLQQWRRVKGDFANLEGFWKLEPLEDGSKTQVTYASYVDGGFFLPQGLIKRQARIDMPHIMAALRNQAETSREIAANKRPADTTH